MLSSTVPDRYVRPAIAFVIFASGLKYVGVATTALGWILCATLLAAGVAWLLLTRPWTSWSQDAPGADQGESRAVADTDEAPEPTSLTRD